MSVVYEKLNLPDSPGIYLFYNKQKELVYVGKATSLRSRVRSYFHIKKVTRPIEAMMHEITAIKFKTTDSVLEAVILEANYIKGYLPKYNVLGKDNRSWNYIVITKEEYPQIKTIRQHEYELLKKQKNKKAKKQIEIFEDEKTFEQAKRSNNSNISNIDLKQFQYVFGPYPGLNSRAALKILRQIFHFSSCTPDQKRPCLYYQMGQCYGVCTGEISPKEYKEKVIQPLVLFLKGQKKKVIKNWEKKMKTASKQQDYEEAGRLRDQLKSLYRIQDITMINKSMVGIDQELRITNEELRGDPKQGSGIRNSLFVIRRIEGYDISNLGSSGKVASMVVFDTAGPEKSQYRKFKIKTVEGQSDVDCLEEVIRRRFNHPEWKAPDVLLIDGGKPQVNRIDKVLQELHVFIPLVGIAKGPERKRNDFTFPPSIFGDASEVAKDVLQYRRDFVNWVNENQELLIQVRDEAHRFAITFQRKTRRLF